MLQCNLPHKEVLTKFPFSSIEDLLANNRETTWLEDLKEGFPLSTKLLVEDSE